ncbi:MAG: hypothetical protein M3Y09_13235 [Actinomycetota bacterium]|nr:hypothetical protein [Actinomycetota bacterium]
MRYLRILVPFLACLGFAGAAQAAAPTGGSAGGATPPTSGGTTTLGTSTAGTGGAGVGAPHTPPSTPAHPTVPGATAKIIKGIAYAPAFAPKQVQEIIWAGNQIRRKPYIFGGGHGVWRDAGYDCSGSVSYVLHAAGLIKTSMDSSQFENWGDSGLGQWVTVFANPGHAFLEVAGIRMDTSSEGDRTPVPGTGPRWHSLLRSTGAFQSRHPTGF